MAFDRPKPGILFALRTQRKLCTQLRSEGSEKVADEEEFAIGGRKREAGTRGPKAVYGKSATVTQCTEEGRYGVRGRIRKKRGKQGGRREKVRGQEDRGCSDGQDSPQTHLAGVGVVRVGQEEAQPSKNRTYAKQQNLCPQSCQKAVILRRGR